MSAKIETLRKMLAEATPGPWRTAKIAADGPHLVIATADDEAGDMTIAQCRYALGMARANAALIAAAVNTLPALLDAAEALAKTLPYLEEHAVDTCYGAVMVEDPRDFHPDPDASTEEERACHRAACEAWDRGERPETPRGGIAECEITDRKTGEKRKTIGFVERKGFGHGTNTLRDPEAEDLRDRARRALAALAKEET